MLASRKMPLMQCGHIMCRSSMHALHIGPCAHRLNVAANGVAYAPPEARPGVVPRMLAEILGTRIMVPLWTATNRPIDMSIQEISPFPLTCCSKQSELRPHGIIACRRHRYKPSRRCRICQNTELANATHQALIPAHCSSALF